MSHGAGDTTRGHHWPIEAAECRRLLADAAVGRVTWVARAGLTTLPVSYGVHTDGRLGFRVAAGSALAELAEPADVAFEVDDLDGDTMTGWSVLVRGSARAWSGDFPEHLCRPWAPGERTVGIQIVPDSLSGRVVSSDERQGDRP